MLYVNQIMHLLIRGIHTDTVLIKHTLCGHPNTWYLLFVPSFIPFGSCRTGPCVCLFDLILYVPSTIFQL